MGCIHDGAPVVIEANRLGSQHRRVHHCRQPPIPARRLPREYEGTLPPSIGGAEAPRLALVIINRKSNQENSMNEPRVPIVRVGVDLAKQVIQVHAVDASGRRVVARAFKREQFFAWCTQLPVGCLIAMEACSSAHYWGRKLRALGLDETSSPPTVWKARAASMTPPKLQRSVRQRRARACVSFRSRLASNKA